MRELSVECHLLSRRATEMAAELQADLDAEDEQLERVAKGGGKGWVDADALRHGQNFAKGWGKSFALGGITADGGGGGSGGEGGSGAASSGGGARRQRHKGPWRGSDDEGDGSAARHKGDGGRGRGRDGARCSGDSRSRSSGKGGLQG